MTSTGAVLTVGVCAVIASTKTSGDGPTSTRASSHAHASVGTYLAGHQPTKTPHSSGSSGSSLARPSPSVLDQPSGTVISKGTAKPVAATRYVPAAMLPFSGSSGTVPVSPPYGSGGTMWASVVGRLADGSGTSLDSYSHPPRHPISAIASRDRIWRDR